MSQKSFSVLNQSTATDGSIDRCVVLDKTGNPRELIGYDESQTSIQLFNATDGDVLVRTNNRNKELVVITTDASKQDKPLSGLVSTDFYDYVNVFLHFEFPDNGFFIIAGVNDTIYGRSMEDTFKRREQIADLLKGLDPALVKLFGNWLDKSNPSNFEQLSWQSEHNFISDWLVKPIISQTTTVTKDDNDTPHVYEIFETAALWRSVADEEGCNAHYYAVNHPWKELIDGTGEFKICNNIEDLEGVTKVVTFAQKGDQLISIKLYSSDGLPKGAIIKDWIEADELMPLVKPYDIKLDMSKLHHINDKSFKSDRPFNLGLKSLSDNELVYKHTRYLNDKKRVVEVDLLNDFYDKEFYKQPHIHVFTNTHYDNDEYILVNININ